MNSLYDLFMRIPLDLLKEVNQCGFVHVNGFTILEQTNNKLWRRTEQTLQPKSDPNKSSELLPYRKIFRSLENTKVKYLSISDNLSTAAYIACFHWKYEFEM